MLHLMKIIRQAGFVFQTTDQSNIIQVLDETLGCIVDRHFVCVQRKKELEKKHPPEKHSSSSSDPNPPKLTCCGWSLKNSLSQKIILWLTFRSRFCKRHEIMIHVLDGFSTKFQRKFVDSPYCDFCKDDEETFLHMFWECPKVQDLWLEVQDYLHKHFEHCTNITFWKELIAVNMEESSGPLTANACEPIRNGYESDPAC